MGGFQQITHDTHKNWSWPLFKTLVLVLSLEFAKSVILKPKGVGFSGVAPMLLLLERHAFNFFFLEDQITCIKKAKLSLLFSKVKYYSPRTTEFEN